MDVSQNSSYVLKAVCLLMVFVIGFTGLLLTVSHAVKLEEPESLTINDPNGRVNSKMLGALRIEVASSMEAYEEKISLCNSIRDNATSVDLSVLNSNKLDITSDQLSLALNYLQFTAFSNCSLSEKNMAGAGLSKLYFYMNSVRSIVEHERDENNLFETVPEVGLEFLFDPLVTEREFILKEKYLEIPFYQRSLIEELVGQNQFNVGETLANMQTGN